MKTEKKDLARSLRRKMTDPEKLLWYRLRNRKLNGLKFRRQQPFGPFVLDFYCAEHRINIEVDGGQHDLPEHRDRDMRRRGFLEKEGVRTLRFWNSQICDNLDGVLYRIRKDLGLEDPSP